MSVASAALRNESTGAPTGFRSDVVATAKRDLRAGEVLDGEGGYCIWGKQMPAAASLELGGLPLGLASDVTLKRDIAEGEPLSWDDVMLRCKQPGGQGATRNGSHVRRPGEGNAGGRTALRRLDFW